VLLFSFDFELRSITVSLIFVFLFFFLDYYSSPAVMCAIVALPSFVSSLSARLSWRQEHWKLFASLS
jgi:hypothetical protein